MSSSVRKHPLDVCYGDGTYHAIRNAKVLVIGAGGVGCEVVKNLVISEFNHVTLIDMDTIDVSNLNRQFLFRRKHVGQPKSTVAAEQAASMRPQSCHIESEVASIMVPKFDVRYFRQFDVILNALDNAEARRHVNRMALAAVVPLVESGSTGYDGQTCVVDPGNTECFDCWEKPAPKSFAVCTIRSTPDKPVHCIVWAKFLFNLMFGPRDESNVLADLDMDRTEKSDNTENASTTQQEPLASPGGTRIGVRWDPSEPVMEYVSRVAKKIYMHDIEEQISMRDLWIDRRPPRVVDLEAVACDGNSKSWVDPKIPDLHSQVPWTVSQSARVFLNCAHRIVEERPDMIGELTFDKDDNDAMAFVAAAANLRAHAYGVELVSPFHAKGIAGNIIHAIATTNAVVAGLVVLEALSILSRRSRDKKCSLQQSSYITYITKDPKGRVARQIHTSQMNPPNPKCPTCASGSMILELRLHEFTLRKLVDEILKQKIGMISPCIDLKAGQEFASIIYESGEGLEEDEIEMYNSKLGKTLVELGFKHGSTLTINDFDVNTSCIIYIADISDDSSVEPGTFFLVGEPKVGTVGGEEPLPEEGSVQNVPKNPVDDSDELHIVDADDMLSKKRRRESDDGRPSAGKKAKGDADNDVIVID